MLYKYFMWLIGFIFPYKTRRYRLDLYKDMLDNLDGSYKYRGFCVIMNSVHMQRRMKLNIPLWRFPALWKYRPFVKECGGYWFNIDNAGAEKRRNILIKISKVNVNERNHKIMQTIIAWQEAGFVHPMTCATKSSHELLVPQIVNDRVVLVCPTCARVQEHIPSAVLATSEDGLMKMRNELISKGFKLPEEV